MTPTALIGFMTRLPGAILDTLTWGVHHPQTVIGGCVIAGLLGASGYLSTRRTGRK